MRGAISNTTAILILLALVMPAAGASVKEYVSFTAQMEEMKAHLEASLEALKEGKKELAVEHAKHPVEEYWALVGSAIKERDPELYEELERTFEGLVAAAESGDLESYSAEVEKTVELLDRAKKAVVPDKIGEGFIFNARVLIMILEAAENEYEEGVSETGQLVEEAEYVDALFFLKKAEELYAEMSQYVGEEEDTEIKEFFENAEKAMEEKKPPEDVESAIGGIIHELKEVTDLPEEKGAISGAIDYIENVEQLLNAIVKEYEEGEYAEAEEFAIKAYLENFEFVEGELGKKNPELNEELEELLRVKLREAIQNRVAVEDLKTIVSNILEKLEKAEELLKESGGGSEETLTTPTPAVTPVAEAEQETPVLLYGLIAVLAAIAVVEGAIIAKLRRK